MPDITQLGLGGALVACILYIVLNSEFSKSVVRRATPGPDGGISIPGRHTGSLGDQDAENFRTSMRHDMQAAVRETAKDLKNISEHINSILLILTTIDERTRRNT